MSRKLHIYCHNEWEIPTIDFHSDPPLTWLEWCVMESLVVMNELAWFLCLLIAIRGTWFTKNNHLSSGIRVANALTAVIIFIWINSPRHLNNSKLPIYRYVFITPKLLLLCWCEFLCVADWDDNRLLQIVQIHFCYCKTFRTRFQSDLSEKYYVTQKNVTYIFKGLFATFFSRRECMFSLMAFCIPLCCHPWNEETNGRITSAKGKAWSNVGRNNRPNEIWTIKERWIYILLTFLWFYMRRQTT